MKTIWKIAIFFGIMILFFLVAYNFIVKEKTIDYYDNRNKLCFEIANELNKNINDTIDNVTCIDYYCYYAPYKPPTGLEDTTETLCICDCKTENGTIISTQVLNPNFNN